MKKLVTTLCTVAALAVVANASFAANAVRISQIYSGGAGGSATYLRDYVELFNFSGSAVDVSGWALEYASATGTWGGSGGTNYYVFPAGTVIQACGYLLIETGSAGTVGTTLPVTPDLSSPTTVLSLSNTSGNVGLFTAIASNVACGSVPPGTIVDKVSYGTGNCPEGTALASPPTQASVMVRNNGGIDDTDANSVDFTIQTTATALPRNSASPRNTACLATPATSSTWGALKSIYR